MISQPFFSHTNNVVPISLNTCPVVVRHVRKEMKKGCEYQF